MAAVIRAVRKREEAAAAQKETQNTDEQVEARRTHPVQPLVPILGFWKYQPHAEKIYLDLRVQVSVAGLIVGNFIVNIIEKQIDPRGDTYPDTFAVFELFFNVAFTIELTINMYAFWLCRFWKSGWNIFDFIVVSIGLATTFNVPLPGPFKMLRMMRAFRVFRLFKRVKSLNKIMTSLAKAVPGVANAFLILLIVMSIYAILATELFMDYGKDGSYMNNKNTAINSTSARGIDYGDEYFGYFSASLYTMFQVLTGESWSEVVARPLLFSESRSFSVMVMFFFVSFVLINAVVLINVVVAVLLEKMVDDEPPEEEKSGTEDAPPEPTWAGFVQPHGRLQTVANGCEDQSSDKKQVCEMRAGLKELTRDMELVKSQLGALMTHMQLQGPRTAAQAQPAWSQSSDNAFAATCGPPVDVS